jgi:predicted nucleic acid-binding protein
VIVVDANVLLPYILKNEATATVQALRERDAVWRFPALWRHEVANGMIRYVTAGRCEREEVALHYGRALEIFSVGELPVPDAAALDLAMRKGLSAYDAAYVAMAQEIGTVLVTFDQALVRKAGHPAILVEDFLA